LAEADLLPTKRCPPSCLTAVCARGASGRRPGHCLSLPETAGVGKPNDILHGDAGHDILVGNGPLARPSSWRRALGTPTRSDRLNGTVGTGQVRSLPGDFPEKSIRQTSRGPRYRKVKNCPVKPRLFGAG
jgi:hypothetical protein